MVDTTLSRQRAHLARWPAWIAEALLLVLAAVLVIAPRIQNLDAYTGSFDEGIRAQQLLLMSAGYRPFKDIFASQGPLLLDLLYPFYLVFGESLTAIRAGVVVWSLVALAGAWWTIRQLAGPLAGLAAVVVLGLSPAFLEGSRLALAEVPSLAPALLSLALAVAYTRTGRRRLLVLSAGCCALALLVKPMVLHAGVPLLVLLVGAHVRPAPTTPAPQAGEVPRARFGLFRAPGEPGVRARLTGLLLDLLLYGTVVTALCGLAILLLGPAQVWDNLGAYRSGAGGGLGSDASENLRLTANVMRREQAGLFVLAAVGLALGLWRRPVPTLALGAWAAAVLGLFALYGDLADKHIVYLVPALALLAALAAGIALEAAREVTREVVGTRRRRWPPVVTAVLGGLGIVAYLVTLPAVYRADLYLIREAPKVAAARRGQVTDIEIAVTIRTETPPDGWVLSDNPGAAFSAGRKVIPYLVDTSGTRIDAGSLTTPLATEYVERYRPSVIVTWPGRLGKLDDFVRSLPALGYRLERRYENGWRVYVREW